MPVTFGNALLALWAAAPPPPHRPLVGRLAGPFSCSLGRDIPFGSRRASAGVDVNAYPVEVTDVVAQVASDGGGAVVAFADTQVPVHGDGEVGVETMPDPTNPHGADGFWTRLATLRTPSLFVWGRRDRVVPIAFARHVREVLPAAEHLELDCGHVPQLERPRETHAALARFFTGSRAGRGAGARRPARAAP